MASLHNWIASVMPYTQPAYRAIIGAAHLSVVAASVQPTCDGSAARFLERATARILDPMPQAAHRSRPCGHDNRPAPRRFAPETEADSCPVSLAGSSPR